MRKSIGRWGRGLSLLLSAGLVLQAGGCVSNPNELFAGLLASVANTTIANFVFGAFGLAT